MSAAITASKYMSPPGGVWFFDGYGEHVELPTYDMAVRAVAGILRRNGDPRSPADAISECMCPQMPRWFCRGEVSEKATVHPMDAREEAKSYFARRVVPMDTIMRRMEICSACPKHRRDFCLTCAGHDEYILNGFGGRRPKLASDLASGCCLCAKTFEAVVASVDYGKEEPAWEGVPDTCWRNKG